MSEPASPTEPARPIEPEPQAQPASPEQHHGRRSSVLQAPLSTVRRFLMPRWNTPSPFTPCITDASECKMGVEDSGSVEDDCPICLEALDDNSVKTSCGHHFHRECYDDCFIKADKRSNFKCPICRQFVYGRMTVEARSSSCRAIEVVNWPPPAWRCHMDRTCMVMRPRILPSRRGVSLLCVSRIAIGQTSSPIWAAFLSQACCISSPRTRTARRRGTAPCGRCK